MSRQRGFRRRPTLTQRGVNVDDLVPDGLRDCTPSEQLLYHIIEDADEPVTRPPLQEVTGLTKSTVSRCLSTLEDIGLVEQRTPQAGGRKLVSVADDADDDADGGGEE